MASKIPVAAMKPEFSRDQLGAHALAHYKAVLVEFSETIRQTKQTIEKSQELMRQLDRVIDGQPRQKGYATVTAVEAPPEIIIIIPRDRAQFTRVVMNSPIYAERARLSIASGSPSRSHDR
jgi:hypothetical protein